MNIKDEVLKAEKRIRKYIRETPLEYSPYLSKIGKANVFLKLENQQITGSFKARGSMNKVLSLTDEERKHGVVTASTGNHGLGVARAAQENRIKCFVFVPENADTSKIEAIKEYGAKIKYTKTGVPETISHGQAKQYAKVHGMSWVSPYNDLKVIAGQGTIAIELVKQLQAIDYVFITVGGGGLISGMTTYLNSVSPNTQIIGCLPEKSAEMYYSVKASKFVPIQSEPTLSDGSAGGFEEGSITFPLCQKLIKEWSLVSEDEIKKAIKLILEKHHQVIEGSAGVAVASYLKDKAKYKGKNIVILICGGNISIEKLTHILCNEN